MSSGGSIPRMRNRSKIRTDWSTDFAYAIGLIATDGNLSPDGRHISFTSKDFEMIEHYKSALKLTNKVGMKARGYDTVKRYYVIQFGDVNFYRFLLDIGLTPRKSRTIGRLNIPDEFFYDFLRGCFDGDGTIGTNCHPESKYLQLKIRFYSGSFEFLTWLREMTSKDGIKGYLLKGKSIYALSFAKKDSIKLLKLMYYNGCNLYLTRKRIKAKYCMVK